MALRKATITDNTKVKMAMARIETERLKGKIVSQASHDTIKVLQGLTGSTDCKIIKADTTGLQGNRAFSGILKITSSITDRGYLKQIEIPIEVAGSVAKTPSPEILRKKLDDIVVEDTLHKSIAEKVASSLKEIDEREKKIAEDSKKAAEQREAERKAVTESSTKEAKEVSLPSGGFSYVPSAEVASTLTYSKTALPQSIVVGDVLNIAGRKYLISEGTDALNNGTSSTWILTLQK